MEKEEILKDLKFSNCEVTRPSCLVSFFSSYSDSYMSLCNHIYVIRSISYSESCHSWFSLSYHCHYLLFLFWRYSASQNHITSICDFHYAMNKLVALHTRNQAVSRYNQSCTKYLIFTLFHFFIPNFSHLIFSIRN